jgi:hypothetical protein
VASAKVDILPSKGQELPTPHARVQGGHDERLKPVAAFPKESDLFRWGQDPFLDELVFRELPHPLGRV